MSGCGARGFWMCAYIHPPIQCLPDQFLTQTFEKVLKTENANSKAKQRHSLTLWFCFCCTNFPGVIMWEQNPTWTTSSYLSQCLVPWTFHKKNHSTMVTLITLHVMIYFLRLIPGLKFTFFTQAARLNALSNPCRPTITGTCDTDFKNLSSFC